jgi:hypothetical protein
MPREPFGDPRDLRASDKCDVYMAGKAEWVSGMVDRVDWVDMEATVRPCTALDYRYTVAMTV